MGILLKRSAFSPGCGESGSFFSSCKSQTSITITRAQAALNSALLVRICCSGSSCLSWRIAVVPSRGGLSSNRSSAIYCSRSFSLFNCPVTPTRRGRCRRGSSYYDGSRNLNHRGRRRHHHRSRCLSYGSRWNCVNFSRRRDTSGENTADCERDY